MVCFITDIPEIQIVRRLSECGISPTITLRVIPLQVANFLHSMHSIDFNETN